MSILKKIWKNNSKHKKLSEDWHSHVLGSQLSLQQQQETEETLERRFRLKYVGAVPAERACSAPDMAAAVGQAVELAKAGKRKLRRVEVIVSPKGILVEDAATAEKFFEVSIYRISYCSADAVHSQIFAFIAGGPGETLECHAFLCPKRKMARAATLAAAQSFNTAYQVWQGSQEKRIVKSPRSSKPPGPPPSEPAATPPVPIVQRAPLIDLYSDDESPTNSPWVSFDETATGNLWDDAPAAKLFNTHQLMAN